MARIRSIHPSFFTDEACVSCTPLARLLYIGLWTDADDQGLFEWKPLQLKMRLLPGDNADATGLLDELVEAGLVAKVEGSKRLGAIRDFRSYQRPKKPNAVHVLPPGWRTYVGLDDGSSEPEAGQGATDPEPVPHQFPTKGEKSPQMEDGGEDVGKGKGDGTSSLNGQPAAPIDREVSTALVLSPPTAAKPARKKAVEPTPAEQSEFDAFWNVYPRRVAKQPALEAFVIALRAGADASDIFSGAQAYAGDRAGKDPDKTAHAATWLNAKRWTDEVAAPPPGGFAANQNSPGGKRGWTALDMAAEAMSWTEDDTAA